MISKDRTPPRCAVLFFEYRKRTFNLPPQSVLPLGTTAPVINTNPTKENIISPVWVKNTATPFESSHTIIARANSLGTYSSGGTTASFGELAYTALAVNLANATDAKAIVCIKY